MSTRDVSSVEPRVLLRDLAYVESPRWHDGRLWFAHWGAGEIIAVDRAASARSSAKAHPASDGRSGGSRTAGGC
jgi:hypothetical protein